MTDYTAAEINAAIAQGLTVTGETNDMRRAGQPNNGRRVTIERAIADYGDRVSVRANGYRAAFKVCRVAIEGRDDDAGADL